MMADSPAVANSGLALFVLTQRVLVYFYTFQRLHKYKAGTSQCCRLQSSLQYGTHGGPLYVAALGLVSPYKTGKSAPSLNSALFTLNSLVTYFQLGFWILLLVSICWVYLVQSGHLLSSLSVLWCASILYVLCTNFGGHEENQRAWSYRCSTFYVN